MSRSLVATEGMYRFAYYGRSGSGKTCILATIALGAIGHPGRLTCECLPVKVPMPPPDENGSKPSAAVQEARMLHAGADWIGKAVVALQQGERPSPNQHRESSELTPTVDFRITSPDRGVMNMRMIDYAGELINPAEEHVQESLQNSLKGIFQECDGFLLVVETPATSQADETWIDELRLLREAFASLGAAKPTDAIPVAVVLSKFDRYCDVHKTSLVEQRQKLQELVNSQPALDALANAISNSSLPFDTKEQDELAGITRGNCRLFGASAFGRAVNRGGGESPDLHERRPVAILDPLIWLAQRRDDLDAELIEARWRKLGWWQPWATARLYASTKRLLDRMPDHLEADRRVAAIRRAAWRRVSAIASSSAVVLLLCALVGWDYFRAWQYQARVSSVSNPQASSEEIREARNWFDSYSRCWNGFYFAPGKSLALAQVSHLDGVFDKQQWDLVEGAVPGTAKSKAAKQYLSVLPHGAKAAECQQLANYERDKKCLDKNDAWLLKLNSDVVAKEKELPALATLRLKAEGDFPCPNAVNDDLRKRRREIVDKIDNIIPTLKWGDFVAEYQRLMELGDMSAVARWILDWKRHDEDWQKLVKDWPDQASDVTKKLVDKIVEEKNFTEALIKFEALKAALEEIELTIRPENKSLANHLIDKLRELDPWKSQILQSQDQHLYSLVLKTRTKEVCDTYLKEAKPKPVMQREVQNYLDTLNARSKLLTLTVSLKIKWDTNYTFGNDNRVRVWVDDVMVLETKDFVKATVDALSGEVGPFTITNKHLDGSVKIRITIVEVGYFQDRDGGQYDQATKLRTMEHVQSLLLVPSSGSAFQNEAQLKIISGLPPLGALPPWKK